MPRRLRPRFPFTGYTLQAERGLFNLTGRDAAGNRTYIVPEQPAGTRRIVAGARADSRYASSHLKKEWRTTAVPASYIAGDYLDASGTQQGTNNYATFSVTANGVFITLDSATHPGLVSLFNKLLDDNTGIHIRKVSGAAACAFHQGSAANPPVLTLTNASGTVYTPTLLHGRGLLGYSDIRAPGFMRWNLSGVTGPLASVTLRLYVSAFYGSITLGINYLDMPYVDALPFVAVPGTLPPDIADVDLRSEAGVLATTDNVALPYTYSPTHYADPAFGVDVLRAGVDVSNTRSIRWYNYPDPQPREIYVAVAHKFEPDDMFDAQDETMFKLVSCGMQTPAPPQSASGSYVYGGLGMTMVYATAPPDQENRNLYGLIGYNMVNGVSYQQMDKAFCVLEPGRWYHFEYRLKLNNYPAADGEYEVWVNGNRVFLLTGLNWQGSFQAYINSVQWQLYHGGVKPVRRNFWVPSAKFQASTTRIGVPAGFLTAQYPAWRQNKTKDQVYTISGTNLRSQVIARSLDIGAGAGVHVYGYLDAYCGVATTNSAMYGLANGGHQDFDGNCVWKLDFSQSSPVMSVVNPESPVIPTMVDADANLVRHNADGKPASSHTYFCQQWIPSKGIVARIGSSAYWGQNSFGGVEFDAFNVINNQWSAADTYPDIPLSPVSRVPTVARDPRNDDIYYVNATACRRWRADGGTVGFWETVTLSSLNDSFHPMIVDPARNRLVILDNTSLKIWDIGNRSLSVSGTGARTVIDLTSYGLSAGRFPQEHGFLYDPDNDRYLALHYRQLTQSNPVTEIWAINPDTYACTLLHTNLGGASALPYVGNDGQRPYNKFAYLKDYKCVVYLCNTTSDIVFMPTA